MLLSANGPRATGKRPRYRPRVSRIDKLDSSGRPRRRQRRLEVGGPGLGLEVDGVVASPAREPLRPLQRPGEGDLLVAEVGHHVELAVGLGVAGVDGSTRPRCWPCQQTRRSSRFALFRPPLSRPHMRRALDSATAPTIRNFTHASPFPSTDSPGYGGTVEKVPSPVGEATSTSSRDA
jgi:hypothetical protein